MATTREIAEILNVSQSTVSRALNNSRLIGEKRRKEIQRLAAEMDYTPKPFRKSTSESIGLVISTTQAGAPDNEFMQKVIVDVQKGAAEHGYHVYVCFVSRDSDVLPDLIVENRVDGIVFAGFPAVALCQKVREKGIPSVSLHDQSDRIMSHAIYADIMNPMKEAVGRLVELGHRQVGFVHYSTKYPTISSMHQGFMEGLSEQGLEPALLYDGIEENYHGGIIAAQRFLRSGAGATALMFANDWMATGAMYEFAREGVTVPVDVSVIGYGNISIGSQIEPRLTTIQNPIQDSIRLALELIEKQVNNELETTTQLMVSGCLLWKESCAAVSENGGR